MTIKNAKRVEVCSNEEWYKVFGPLDCLPEDDASEAVAEYRRVAFDTLANDDRAADLDVVNAQGQRALCHGWNGAQWVSSWSGQGYSVGGLGTFADLTDEEKEAIDDADAAATAAAEKTLVD